MALGPSTEAINQSYDSSHFQAIGLDHYGGNLEAVKGFKDGANITYPVCLNGAGTRIAYKATSATDYSVVIDQQGIIRYKNYGVNQSEIKAVIDGLLATSIKEEPGLNKPQKFDLHQNYPNPFNPTTTITFNLPDQDYVSVQVFNIVGQKMATLVEKELNAGLHTIRFNAADLPSGIYFYKLKGNKFSAIKRMILHK